MRVLIAVLVAAALASSGCERPHGSAGAAPATLSPATRAAVSDGVRQFAQDVAHDVTREGPAAWHRYFSASASFFMAADGQLVFSNATSAARGIDDLTRTVKSIELRWGDDLRVDPLTPDLAVMASSWSELRVAADGGRVTDRGYFTAVAERRDGRWKFRNAHWSVAAAAPKAP
jgi:hypothetical protein